MAKHEVISLTTTAVAVSPANTHSGMDITIQNVSPSGYAYLGTEGVTTSNFGYRLAPGHAFSIELAPNDSLYAIASAPVNIAVFQFDLESQG